MLPETQKKAFAEFYDVSRNSSALDRKTTVLIGLASAMALGCAP
jgi:alkylhydroperoxidase/carboxymuconolactone decarboxylase family protein YurZ